MSICNECWGKGWIIKQGVQFACRKCKGKGFIENEPMTNKEYMHTCRDDELVALLCELVDSGILQEWRIKYRCADSDEDAVRMWLKEKHE